MVTTTNIFVDKTMFIKQIIDTSDESILITRPRRGGKSLNMNMLYHFLNKETDEAGKLLMPPPHWVLFAGGEIVLELGGKKQLEPLSITKDPLWENKYSKHQGAYPVILMSWKDIKPKNFLEAKKNIAGEIKKAFKKHFYLQSSEFQDWSSALNDITKPIVKN